MKLWGIKRNIYSMSAYIKGNELKEGGKSKSEKENDPLGSRSVRVAWNIPLVTGAVVWNRSGVSREVLWG